MNDKKITNNIRGFELENSSLIENTAKAIANGALLIDVRVESSPSHYHPWLSELMNQFEPTKEFTLAEDLIFDQAILGFTKRLTLGLSTGGFLENALNGNVKELKKDIDRHAVDLNFDENHVLTSFKIKLKDISAINIMRILL